MLRYLEVKLQLKNLIAETTPGEKLPDRLTLCRILDTTRTTLDKAIRELSEEGMLTSRKGSGTYTANYLNIRSAKSNNWCVIVPTILEPIYNMLVSGIERFAQQKGVNVILCNSESLASKQEVYVQRMMKSGIDGIIMVPVIPNDPLETYRLYSDLISSDIPLVFCNRAVEGISVPVVTSNDFYGGYIATKHLIARGYRRIAYISRQKYKTSTDRCQGYMSALIECGIDIDRKLIRVPGQGQRMLNGVQEVKLLLDKTDIDAVFCFDDQVALEVANALKGCGRVISNEIGLIGYNNADACAAYTPALSSVSYKASEIGSKAAEVLYDSICGRKPSSGFEYYLFQPEIIERASCRGRVR